MTEYLFQIDGAQNNDAFFNALRTSASFFFKGSTFRVGEAPWIPDGVRVDVHESRCLVTLIELEDTKPNALISSRKYLPEDSTAILRALSEYVDRIISQCKSTGDPREVGFTRLKDLLGKGIPSVVKTACALRSSTETVEELALIDQLHLAETLEVLGNGDNDDYELGEIERGEPQTLQGMLRLDRQWSNALGRGPVVLDAVIRQQDHGGGTFNGWRSRRAPLKRLLSETQGNPTLRQLVLGANRTGMKLDFEILLSEMVSLWKSAFGQLELEDTRRLITAYFPIASRIRKHDRMDRIFEEARRHIEGVGKKTLAVSSAS
jgi:hypothetical protein